MSEPLNLDFPACLAEDFSPELPVALAAVERVIAALDAPSYATLERHSPALKANDWANYLRCSVARMVHAAGALRRAGVRSGRILDYGAYFGNFSGMFTDLGFNVDAVDFFRKYGDSLALPVSLMRDRGVTLLDFDDVGRDLAGLPEAGHDVVLCAGVIEHMPHSPKGLLASLNRVLKPGGYLIVDTPNVAHLYKRQALARGESVWPPLEAQFHSPIPYEGHHREYTAEEVAWMLHEVGHAVLSIELYSYSCYEQPELLGRDVTNFWKTVADPTAREYITTLSCRGEQTTATGPPPDWRTLLVESEPHWLRHQPADTPALAGDGLVALEPLLVQLQEEVAARDRELSSLRAEDADIRRAMVAATTARDVTIDALSQRIGELNDELGTLRGALETRPGEVVKRAWRRLMGTSTR